MDTSFANRIFYSALVLYVVLVGALVALWDNPEMRQLRAVVSILVYGLSVAIVGTLLWMLADCFARKRAAKPKVPPDTLSSSNMGQLGSHEGKPKCGKVE